MVGEDAVDVVRVGPIGVEHGRVAKLEQQAEASDGARGHTARCLELPAVLKHEGLRAESVRGARFAVGHMGPGDRVGPVAYGRSSMTAASSADAPRTYGDLRRWRDDTRWELVEGQAYAMTGPSWQHQAVTMGLSAQLLSYFRVHGRRVLPGPLDVRLPRGSESDDAVETVVQPDISVVCDPGKLDERGCRGAPHLVVEVLSPSTAGRDHLTKRALYERHGVREYWIVHPIDRIVTIHRRRSDVGFEPPELFEARGVQRMEGFAGLEIDWDQAFADVSVAE